MTISTDHAGAEAAHRTLVAHVPGQETGICTICLVTAPCAVANAAANRLVDLGLPVLAPVPPARRRPGVPLAARRRGVQRRLQRGAAGTLGWRRRPSLPNI